MAVRSKSESAYKRCISIIVIAAVFFCYAYIYYIPRGGAWFHEETGVEGEYEIALIKFLLYGSDEEEVPVEIDLKAPTRYFETNMIDKDEKFNKTVNVRCVVGENAGNVDLRSEVSYTDNMYGVPEGDITTDSGIYYVFVPIDENDSNFTENFKNKRYREYLDNVMADISGAAAPAGYVAGINEVNEQALSVINTLGTDLPIGEKKKLFYLMMWQEYDEGDWLSSPYSFKVLNHRLTLKIKAVQKLFD